MGLAEKKLGQRVHELRELVELTQAQLAEKVHVTTETVSRLERGQSIPSIARMEDFAKALGVELHELFLLRPRTTPRDRALERLAAAVRGRSAEDIDVVRDVAVRMFARWK